MTTGDLEKLMRDCVEVINKVADERDALRAEVERLRGEQINLIDTAEAMLRAAGWQGTLKELNDCGPKPSAFIATLRAEVERLSADRDRLDWIATTDASLRHDDDPELWLPFGWIVSTPSVDGVGVRDDLREAIDQAMRESVPTSTPTPGTGTQSNAEQDRETEWMELDDDLR